MTDLLRRRWPAVVVTVWAALLLVLAFLGSDATVKEQRDVAAARESVDRAAIDLIRAAGRDAVVRVSRYHLVERCGLSLARGGAEYRRRVELFTMPGREADLLHSVADRLPAGYRAHAGADRFSAHGEGFVELRGSVAEGRLQVDLDTGCRPADEPMVSLRTPPTRTEQTRIDEVVRLVGGSASEPRWRTESIRCDDGTVRGVEVTVASVPDRPLADAADLAPPDARVLVREAHLLAYRQGGVSVVAETRDGALRVTRTTVGC